MNNQNTVIEILVPVLDELDIESELRRNVEKLCKASDFALQQILKHPALIRNLNNSDYWRDEANKLSDLLAENKDIDNQKKILRQFRNRRLCTIIYDDIVLQKSVEQTLKDLTALADRMIIHSLNCVEHRLSEKHGIPYDENENPMQLNIIAMGKLGGGELNFSSDIDLICCYANDGELSGYGHLSYQEYFQRVVRQVSQMLNDLTEDGFVYRVDLRLRPWGESGPTAISHSAFEHYYQLHGREWEQYALVKARVITGCENDKTYLHSILKSYVYRRYHDYRVFEGLAELKDKIDLQARSQKMQDNVKLGSGGIREIEFFVQAFQILKGGRNPQLQSPSIYHSFERFIENNIIETNTLLELKAAYNFLRVIENRIQMVADEQTHNLPTSSTIQKKICSGFGDITWQTLIDQLNEHRQKVSSHFDNLFKRDEETLDEDQLLSENTLDDSANARQLEYLRNQGLDNPEEIYRLLVQLYDSKAWGYMSTKARKRFGSLLPTLLQEVEFSSQQTILFERLLKLFSAIAGRSVYFEFLHQNRNLLGKITRLFNSSSWIAEEVSTYPMLLEHLIHSGELEDRFNRQKLESQLSLKLDNVIDDTELELDTLRLFKREQTLVVAAAELAEEISTLEVGRYLSELAEIILQAVYRLAKRALGKQYGIPQFETEEATIEASFAIIGYGKLGGFELHYQSDLDVIFLHNSQLKMQQTSGPKIIENSLFFARLAQKIISMMNVMTSSGKLYEIDSRLRPDGASGLLVSNISIFEQYQLEKAWTWEHQALVRARLVAGDNNLNDAFSNIKKSALCKKRDQAALAEEIVNMRAKMYHSNHPATDSIFDLKHSRGGLVDIEFMVQYWTLLYANNIGSVNSYSDNISIIKVLLELELISQHYDRLIAVYREYHHRLHETVLQNQPAEADPNSVATDVTYVKECWDMCFQSLIAEN